MGYYPSWWNVASSLVKSKEKMLKRSVTLLVTYQLLTFYNFLQVVKPDKKDIIAPKEDASMPSVEIE